MKKYACKAWMEGGGPCNFECDSEYLGWNHMKQFPDHVFKMKVPDFVDEVSTTRRELRVVTVLKASEEVVK